MVEYSAFNRLTRVRFPVPLPIYAGLAKRPGDGLQTRLDPFNSGIRFQVSRCVGQRLITAFGAQTMQVRVLPHRPKFPKLLRCVVIIKVMCWPVKPNKRGRYPYDTPK